MSSKAPVTGAFSGIGRAFAKYHEARKGNVIITARRLDALDTLKTEFEAEHGVTATAIALDLGAEGGAQALYDRVRAANVAPDMVINNAGSGGHGAFVDRDLEADLAMIDLNVKALVTLCHRFGRDMADGQGGKILNVSSTAAHMPGPLKSTYVATKAFVSSFSQAIAE